MLPPEIEQYRDHYWQREASQRIETVQQAEAFINHVGFANSLTDSRKPGPSLYISVCGRRDVQAPRNVQKDPEMSTAWLLKDEIVRRGRIYYGKLGTRRTMFVSRTLVPSFYSLFGISRKDEKKALSEPARKILSILRKEFESASIDLRRDAGIDDRKIFNKAMDELQAKMLVIGSEVVYEPKFTYIWTLAEVRFAEELTTIPDKKTALTNIAKSFIDSAGMTTPGELARIIGVSRPDAGIANRTLLSHEYATSPSTGTYQLTDLAGRLRIIGIGD